MKIITKDVNEVLQIAFENIELEGYLRLPKSAKGVVIFAHGSGSSRLSPRNRSIADYLYQQNIGSLLFDLLTQKEGEQDEVTAVFRFDIPFLAERLVKATDWLLANRLKAEKRDLPVGFFGASTGAAAALIAAAQRPKVVKAVVSRGGRPDLAASALAQVKAPTLLIVGGNDIEVLRLNREASRYIRAPQEIYIVEGATHLFEEPGALDEVARMAAQWFERHFTKVLHS